MNGMTGFWNYEKALRLAGEERGWTYYPDIHGWMTFTGMHVLLEANPPHVRVAGHHGGVVEFGSVPEAIQFIGEDPLPPKPHRPRVDMPDRIAG